MNKENEMLNEFPSSGFKDGYLCFWNGRRADENPYRVGTEYHTQWKLGNQTAEAEHFKLFGDEG